MIAEKKELILRELEEGTGAAITAVVDRSGLRSSLRIWFADLDEKHGPVANLRPYGLKGHRVDLSFGNFSGVVLGQIRNAAPEDVQLARALVASIRADVEIEVPGQNLPEWSVTNGAFRMTAKIRDLDHPQDDATVIATCRDVIVPMMAAMAELIGYDVIEEPADDDVPAFEGAILQSVVKRRERNPRNRLLCIRIHGEKCAACGSEPRLTYGTRVRSSRSITLNPWHCLRNRAPTIRARIWCCFARAVTAQFTRGARSRSVSRNSEV